jgi:hypothetical protein
VRTKEKQKERKGQISASYLAKDKVSQWHSLSPQRFSPSSCLLILAGHLL